MNYPFREKHPTRSTSIKSKNDYKSYKPQLKIDFNSRCGYCDSLDTWKETYYEVDHFVPKSILIKIKENDYQNLVYSCRSCNNAKRKQWYGFDENVHNNGKEGFIDPCKQEYADLFYRTKNGDIKYKAGNEIAKWIYEKLQLYKQDHALIWKISRIDFILNEIDEIEKKRTLSQTEKELESQLLKIFREFLKLLVDQRG